MAEPAYLYKIVSSHTPPPDPLPQRLPLSDLDVASGFIHLSTATQVKGTVKCFFEGEPRVFLLKISFERVKGNIKWEDPHKHVQGDVNTDGRFPHLYSTHLGKEEVESYIELEKGIDDWETAFERVNAWLVY
ncbi:hypothetical protein AMATHDRAFT_189062 [Amanita thiersii Skay4041]|uniref:DUF952 domain-containing protein n=1 Tax=Amanita thiersii Skay4041 TaxID=703135 RepID=A0A2A9NY34_9AGAR|nr:hypothetical protein AMATHDRAFT_189062 [Amanita thiersii Skay4041]